MRSKRLGSTRKHNEPAYRAIEPVDCAEKNCTWFVVFFFDIVFDHIQQAFIAGNIGLNQNSRLFIDDDQVIIFVYNLKWFLAILLVLYFLKGQYDSFSFGNDLAFYIFDIIGNCIGHDTIQIRIMAQKSWFECLLMPSKSCNTNIWPSACGPAPIPIVGMERFQKLVWSVGRDFFQHH
jgi:hypothetical protein